MNPGDVVLAAMIDIGSGTLKFRPAVVLAGLPGPYQTLLLAGISTRLRDVILDWDEPIQPGDADFPASGLHRPSVIRLSYIQAVPDKDVRGPIGIIDPPRLDRLLVRLADHLRP